MNNKPVSIAKRQFEELGLASDALLSAAARHEATLARINVDPLKKLDGIDDDYLYWFRHLFLMTFFYDYCLDRSNEEQFPEAMFISVNMFSEYRKWIEGRYGDESIRLLENNNAQQAYYQMIEKQWLHPVEYHRNHPSYGDYYKKQVLCLTHLELLKLEEKTREVASKVVDLYKGYWSLVLLIDDIMDAEKDVESKTITPMIGAFYAENGRMPTLDDVGSLRTFGVMELNRLFPLFEKNALTLGASEFLEMIVGMRDGLHV